MTINVCLIGCGYISQKHLQVMASLEEMTLHSLCDIDLAKTKEAEATFRSLNNKRDIPTIQHYSQAEKALNNKDIDLVIITTASSLHASLAKKALEAGKHVILEKPMALSLEDAKELHHLSKSQKKILLICHQLRYRPLFQQIKSMINEGVLGQPYLGIASIRINRSEEYYSQARWRGTWDLDGGMLINQGIHFIDLLQWLLGDLHSVYGEIGKGKIKKETEDYAVGVLRFKNKARGIIEANTITLPKNMGYSLSLFFEKASISITGPSLNTISHWYIEGNGGDHPPDLSILDDKQERLYMYQDFIDSVKKGKNDVLVNGAEAIKAIETIFSLYESSRTNQPVYLPLSTFDLASMKEVKKSE